MGDASTAVPFDVAPEFDLSMRATVTYVGANAKYSVMRFVFNDVAYTVVSELADAMIASWRARTQSLDMPPGMTRARRTHPDWLYARVRHRLVSLFVAKWATCLATGGALTPVQVARVPCVPRRTIGALHPPIDVHYLGAPTVRASLTSVLCDTRFARPTRHRTEQQPLSRTGLTLMNQPCVLRFRFERGGESMDSEEVVSRMRAEAVAVALARLAPDAAGADASSPAGQAAAAELAATASVRAGSTATGTASEATAARTGVSTTLRRVVLPDILGEDGQPVNLMSAVYRGAFDHLTGLW